MSQYSYNYNPNGTKSYLNDKINQDSLHAWTKENMYRTSYATMYTDVISIFCNWNLKSWLIKKPHEPKNHIVPGYTGFIPGYKSRTEFGRTFAKVAKESLNKPSLGFNTHGLASTG